MIEDIRKIKSEKSDLRKFGITVGAVLLVIAGFLFLKEKELFKIISGIGITLSLTAIAIPVVLKPIYLMLMIFAIIFGWCMTRVILSLLFYFIFAPMGLTFRMFGKMFLQLRFDKSKKSYWNIRTNKHLQNETYEMQF